MINSDNLKQPMGLEEHESMTLERGGEGGVGWSVGALLDGQPYRVDSTLQRCPTPTLQSRESK